MSSEITKLANVIVPEKWHQYVVQKTTELVNFWGGGIVQRTQEFDDLLNGGGNSMDMPFWNDLDGDDDIWVDTADIETAKLTTGQDEARRLNRQKAWQHSDLSALLAGSDPVGALADRVANYWSRKMQTALIKTLTGVFADNIANDSLDMVKNVAAESTGGQSAATKWSRDNLVDAIGTMGDAWGGITGMAVHSAVFKEMQKQGEITFITPQDAPLRIPFYDNIRVIVDDSCPVTAGSTSGFKYDCFFFGPGAIAWGESMNVKHPIEFDRDALGSGGTDIIVTRKSFILHPRGIRFVGSPSASSPTNAELAAATSWDRVYSRKNVKLAMLRINA